MKKLNNGVNMAWLNIQRKRTFQVWSDMKQRCFNKNNNAYPRYGGRGISVCDQWKDSFQDFISDMGEKPEGMSLDRIDNDKGYSPDNCRWATVKIQNNNKECAVVLEFDGKRMTATEWAEALNITRETILSRLRNKLPIELVLSTDRMKRQLNKKMNTSGYVGVSPAFGRWRAQIRRNGKVCSIGYFDTPEEASCAYQKERERTPQVNLKEFRNDDKRKR